MYHKIEIHLFAAIAAFAFSASAGEYDVAAYVWPAYHNEPRWAELGIFKEGKGEWQNLYESVKRTPYDYQGVKPLWGYEDESDPVAVARKIDAATAAGVNVFIYDWYWYGGRPFLEDALNKGFLGAKNSQRMKFYIMYANHDVNRLWDNKVGGKAKNEIVWHAKISDADWRTIVARWIKQYFTRPNYYKIKGCPVLMIYDIGSFVKWDGEAVAKERIAYLRQETKKAGFPDVHLQILCSAYFPHEPDCCQVDLGADSMSIYNWRYKTASRLESKTEPELTYRQWGEMSMKAADSARVSAAKMGAVYFPNITVGWDTNARYPKDDRRNIVRGSNPADFEDFARQVREWADANIPAGMPKLITVNSWNEWTEGTYLEPDDKFGYGYLDALRRVFVDGCERSSPKRRNGSAEDVGTVRTYANPVDLPYRMRPEKGQDFREGADPEVVVHDGRYWMFASKCGGYYVSDDLVRWRFVATDDLPLEEYAPTAWEMEGRLYFSSRGGSVHRAVDAAAGKWERIERRILHTVDSKLFFDGGRLFDYYGGDTNRTPLHVQELDPSTFIPVGPSVAMFEIDDRRFGWDVRGDSNEMTYRTGYKEGANMLKRNGVYYFQYATPGTQFASYCDVAMIGASPVGPFRRQTVNPFSYKPWGYIKGAGHGSTFCDRNGNWWHVTTGVVRGVDRRIVMFPVFFDSDGEMWCDTAFADWPVAVPDRKVTSPEECHVGWMPLSYAKRTSVSSSAQVSGGDVLVDEDIRTSWSAASGEPGEWAEVDFGGTAEVRAVQVAFADAGNADVWRKENAVRRWRLEASMDGLTWRTVVDESGAVDAADHPYRTFERPVLALKLRVVCVEVPVGARFALREIRAFGRMDKSRPLPPKDFVAVRNANDPRRINLSWVAADGANGYLVRYGPAPDKLHLSLMVRDGCKTEIRSLDSRQDYWWTVEAFNEAGFSVAVKSKRDAS